jgi:DNA-binding NarL/FixJ family response regulator
MLERVPVHVRGLDPVLTSGISTLLRPRPEVVLTEGGGEQVANAVTVLVGDVVDQPTLAMMRELGGTGLLKARILLVVANIDDNGLLSAIEAGAGGVVPRAEATPERLVTAICQVATAGGSLSPRLVGRLLGQVTRLQHQVLAPRGMRFSGLSERETDVLKLVAQGMEVREIAEKLSYSERTIKKTMHDVLNRFQLRNRAHAIAYALQEGLI